MAYSSTGSANLTNPMNRTDILGRTDIIKLVDSFYLKVRADEPLGNIFDGVAKVDWETHLPKLYNFWDSVLFRAGTFRGNPIAAHMKLIEHADMSWPMFERWLVLFRATVNELFKGENADHIVRCAEDMARVIHSKIHAIPNLSFDPETLTPEQKARYASNREPAQQP